MSTLSYSQCAEYIKGPAVCPYCGSYQVVSKGELKVSPDDITVKRLAGCERCKKAWKDVYKLHDIEEIE